MKTASVVNWLIEFNLDEVSPSAGHEAKRCLLDTLGVALAGRDEDVSRLVQAYATEEGRSGRATLWGGGRTSPALAALVNGTMAHALDLDETNYSAIAHPAAVVLPAVLALAESQGRSGADLLLAFVAGYEITAKLGRAVCPEFYHRGWWTTTTLGVIGAAAGAAKVLGLDRERIGWALGLAAGKSSGLRVNFGTWAKPFLAGQAAHDGLLAASLAGRGMTASGSALEGPCGFYQVLARGEYRDVEMLLGQPLDLERPGVAYKLHPSCSASHAAVDAALALVGEHGLDWRKITAIRAEVTPLVRTSLNHDRPATPDQARFSLPFCLAAALRFGDLDPGRFSPQVLADPEIQGLQAKVAIGVPADLSPGGAAFREDAPEAARITLVVNGQEFTCYVPNARGNPQNPLADEELTAKFEAQAGRVLGPERRQALARAVWEVEDLAEAAQLTRLLQS